MAEKSPAFQFYPKDVLSDGDAMAMPVDAFGIYMRLLCFDWIDDGLVDDDRTLMRLGGYDGFDYQGNQREHEDWEVILSHVRGKFINHPTKEGYITSPRLLKERQNQKERSEKAKESADKRWHPKNDANALRRQCSSSSSSSSSSNNNTQALKVPVSFPPDFEFQEATQLWDEWLLHKKSLGKPYKSTKSQQVCLNQWAGRFSDFRKAVYHSIGNNYQGLYLPSTNGSTNGKSKHEAEEARVEALYQKALAEDLANEAG